MNTKVRYRQTIEATIIRCGCAVKGQHPGQVCPNGWVDDQGIISESEGSFDIVGDPVELAEQMHRQSERGKRGWLRKILGDRNGEPSK